MVPLISASMWFIIYVVRSPMVGTFYRASSPESKPFVDTGLFQQFDQFLDFANIHEALTPR